LQVKVTAEAARRFLVARHFLAPAALEQVVGTMSPVTKAIKL